MSDYPPKFRKNNSAIIVYIPKTHLHEFTTQIYQINFTDLLLGRYILHIKFFGTIDDNKSFRTLYSMENETIGWIAATHFGKNGARKLFPCWDEPELKATFDISIMHDKNHTVFSNLPIQNIYDIDNFISCTQFFTTPAISTYLVIAGVIRFEIINDIQFTNIIITRLYAVSSLLYAENVITNMTLYLKSEWKQSEMISKINHIAIPNFHVKDMVFSGIVLYRESDILYKHNSDPIARKFEVEHRLGRKIVEEWFLNMLNTSSWLNEALITFLTINIINNTLPNSRIIDLFVVQTQQDLYLELDDEIIQSQTNKSGTSLCKAFVLLRMLQHAFTKELFWNGIRKYLHSNKPSYQAFQETIIAEYSLQYQNKSRSKIEFLSIFINTTNLLEIQKYYPVINVNRNYNISYTIALQSYNDINVHGNFSGSCIPLTYMTLKNDFINTIWLTKKKSHKIIKLPKEDDWIIFNIQQTGYYRVNYDSRNWIKISYYMNSENYKRIHVLNRAQIIDDAFHFIILERDHYPFIFWELVTYLKEEEDFVAWYPMFKALEYMSRIFPFEQYASRRLKEKMQTILNTLLEKLKYQEVPSNNEPDLTKCLRQEAAKWACFFNSSRCLEEANRKLNDHLELRIELLPWWKEWTYCNGLQLHNASAWWTIYTKTLTHYDYKILKFLSCSKNPDRIQEYLRVLEATENTSNIKFQLQPIYSQVERDSMWVNCFLITIAKHVMNNDILTYILKNFEIIKLSQVSTIAALSVIINNVYSVELLSKINEYINGIIEFEKLINNDASVLTDKEYAVWKIVLQHVSEFREKIRLRQNIIENQLKFFKNVFVEI